MTARNSHFIDEPGKALELLTPALVLDLDVLERNIAAMATWAAEHNIGLRPHAKTHKSPDIAQRQIDAGANGICCATVKELEVLAAAGIPGLLLTTAAAPAKASWIAKLNAKAEGLAVVVDHMDYLTALAGTAAATGKPLRIKIDVDPGLGRTGVTSAEDAVALARFAAEHPWLEYAGIQAYMGHLQHIPDNSERRNAIDRDNRIVDTAVEALKAANLNPGIVTGGGTGTHTDRSGIGTLHRVAGWLLRFHGCRL